MIDMWLMFSYTILLYALVCNTLIGSLLDKHNDMKKTKKGNAGMFDSEPNRKVVQMSNGVRKTINTNNWTEEKEWVDYKRLAAKANRCGKWSFAAAVLIFNICFWGYAIFIYYGEADV